MFPIWKLARRVHPQAFSSRLRAVPITPDGEEPLQGLAVGSAHAVRRELMAEARDDAHADRHVRFLEHGLHDPGVPGDLVVVARQEKDASKELAMLLQARHGLTVPIAVTGGEYEPAAPSCRVVHADLLQHESPLAEPDEDVAPAMNPSGVSGPQCVEGGIGDLFSGDSVVVPGSPARGSCPRSLRAERPGEGPHDACPGFAVLAWIAPARMEVDDDATRAPVCRRRAVGIRKAGHLQRFREEVGACYRRKKAGNEDEEGEEARRHGATYPRGSRAS
jgi:hypothetical protein